MQFHGEGMARIHDGCGLFLPGQGNDAFRVQATGAPADAAWKF
jgi:hypothetical protein